MWFYCRAIRLQGNPTLFAFDHCTHVFSIILNAQCMQSNQNPFQHLHCIKFRRNSHKCRFNSNEISKYQSIWRRPIARAVNWLLKIACLMQFDELNLSKDKNITETVHRDWIERCTMHWNVTGLAPFREWLVNKILHYNKKQAEPLAHMLNHPWFIEYIWMWNCVFSEHCSLSMKFKMIWFTSRRKTHPPKLLYLVAAKN